MPLQQDRDTPGEEGAARKAHYGAGRQPWDDIVDAGWAPHFATGNVLKYLRRTKDPEHSLESARWYYQRLWELATKNNVPILVQTDALMALSLLQNTLLGEELVRLRYAGT